LAAAAAAAAGQRNASGRDQQHNLSSISRAEALRENGALFLSFPYVCPEPVLVKR
jgi:hypothetical protein